MSDLKATCLQVAALWFALATPLKHFKNWFAKNYRLLKSIWIWVWKNVSQSFQIFPKVKVLQTYSLHSYKLCGSMDLTPALEQKFFEIRHEWISSRRLSEFKKKSLRIRSVTCESCLWPLSPRAMVDTGIRTLWSETNPRAGLASARPTIWNPPTLDWAEPAQQILSLPLHHLSK